MGRITPEGQAISGQLARASLKPSAKVSQRVLSHGVWGLACVLKSDTNDSTSHPQIATIRLGLQMLGILRGGEVV